MATTITLTGYDTGVTDLYAYYVGRSLASYVADKVLFTEGTGVDAGLYTAVVDETKGTSIVAFVGATQPSGWDQQIAGVGWDLIIAAFKADAELGTGAGGMVANVGKIPRAATAVTDGGEVTRNKVSATSSTLTETLS